MNVAGGKLKESGTAHWIGPNTGATNEVGFKAVPAGFWDFSGVFMGRGERCFFRTSSYPDPFDYDRAAITLRNDNTEMKIGGVHPNDSFSVRCIKD